MSVEDNKRIEFIDAQAQPKSAKRKGNFRDIINGNILSRENVTNQIPYILFLAVLAIFYIGNRYKYEKLIRSEQKLHIEVKNLRAESITTASQLMFISKQSQVARLIKERNLDLEESVTPTKKIKTR